ncbi:acyl-CoA thioesterase [Gorillibacterium sp. sgz5001074]|uniref:acyl-CoA thioesterase n=1 Tax=Gorillibacterium sp. sgz5001074 TaxID=3446695 RepID=UPI003F6630F5
MNPYYHTLRVRYAETDQMGVVYHARYLDWFEVGRTEMIRASGMEYRTLEDKGLLLPVVDATIQYRKPARYDDWVEIRIMMTGHSHIRLEFSYEIRNKDTEELLVTGSTRHMWVNRQWKPARIDREAPELYQLLNQISAESE